jgi:hypothetical protein
MLKAYFALPASAAALPRVDNIISRRIYGTSLWPHSNHDPCRLVPHNKWKMKSTTPELQPLPMAHVIATVPNMKIAMAHTTCRNTQQNLRSRNRRIRFFLHHQRGAELN